jgi:hypothetical protein
MTQGRKVMVSQNFTVGLHQAIKMADSNFTGRGGQKQSFFRKCSNISQVKIWLRDIFGQVKTLRLGTTCV